MWVCLVTAQRIYSQLYIAARQHILLTKKTQTIELD